MSAHSEHPFAPFVRILGKGKNGSRALTFDEAHSAFSMILRGDAEPLQLGAFLMLLRVKEETPAELAGFVLACRQYTAVPTPAAGVDLDWPSYSGKRTQHAWYLLAALLLAENGVRILMHGADGHSDGRFYTHNVLQALHIPQAHSLAEVETQLNASNFAFLPLSVLCPPLHAIMQYKTLLGLRSPVNTLVRLLNPLAAPYSLQSVFHPNYANLHVAAELLLGQANALVFKGESGEVEIKPHALTSCTLLRGKHQQAVDWPRSFEGRPAQITQPDPNALLALWRGMQPDRYGELAVINTTAAALMLLEKAATIPAALELAQQYWQARNRSRL